MLYFQIYIYICGCPYPVWLKPRYSGPKLCSPDPLASYPCAMVVMSVPHQPQMRNSTFVQLQGAQLAVLSSMRALGFRNSHCDIVTNSISSSTKFSCAWVPFCKVSAACSEDELHVQHHTGSDSRVVREQLSLNDTDSILSDSIATNDSALVAPLGCDRCNANKSEQVPVFSMQWRPSFRHESTQTKHIFYQKPRRC